MEYLLDDRIAYYVARQQLKILGNHIMFKYSIC